MLEKTTALTSVRVRWNVLSMLVLSQSLWIVPCMPAARAEEYHRATEDKDNVKEKIFTKSGRVEINAPDFGMILNQSLIRTYLLHAGVTYYTSESWGFGPEFSLGINQDKPERRCLETFYNDPNQQIAAECDTENTDQAQRDAAFSKNIANYGPAYMPIREIKYIIAGNAYWNPIYGKQIMFMSATSHFDVFITMGGGIVMSDYYEQLSTLRNGRKARVSSYEKDKPLDGGASTSESDSYGDSGRPAPQSQTHPFVNLGLGQKFHFMKRFALSGEIRNMLLLGTPGGFEDLIAIWGGFSMRF